MLSDLHRYAGLMITWMNLILVLFFAATTFQDSIFHASPMDLSVVEIATLGCLVAWAVLTPDPGKRLREIARRPAAILLLLWAVVATVLWLIAHDWGYGLNEMRWLWLTLGAFILLTTAVESGWGRAVVLFVGITALSALVADYQGMTGAFIAPFAHIVPKEISLSPTGMISKTLAAGFFRHPNAFGSQVFWPLLICLGLALKRKYRWPALAGAAFFAFSLYLSYYRTLLVGLALACAILAMIQLKLRPKLFASITIGLSLLGMIGSEVLVELSQGAFLGNLQTRGGYWVDAAHFIQYQPSILLFGSGYAPSVALASAQARSDPHNMYLYLLMHYGAAGLVCFTLLIALIVTVGWQAYQAGILRREPVLGAMWAGFIAWFVTGTLDSRLTTAEWLMLLVTILVLFLVGLSGQRHRDLQAAPNRSFPSLAEVEIKARISGDRVETAGIPDREARRENSIGTESAEKGVDDSLGQRLV